MQAVLAEKQERRRLTNIRDQIAQELPRDEQLEATYGSCRMRNEPTEALQLAGLLVLFSYLINTSISNWPMKFILFVSVHRFFLRLRCFFFGLLSSLDCSPALAAIGGGAVCTSCG